LGSTPTVSSAARAPTISSTSSPTPIFATATRRSTPPRLLDLSDRDARLRRQADRSGEKSYTADVDAILAAVSARTKVVFLANPNNPTGTYVSFDEVKRLHSGLPPHVLLVIDAAYAEYVRRNDYEAGIELVATSENVVMLRTFSKIYGSRHCAWVGSTDPSIWSMPSTAFAGRSTSMRRQAPPASRRSPTPPMSRGRAPTTTNGSPG